MAGLLGIIAKVGSGAAFSLLGLSTGPVEVVIAELEAEEAASVAFEVSCDPDPCRFVDDYKKIDEPRVPKRSGIFTAQILSRLFRGTVTTETVRLFQRAADANRKVPAFERAVFESCCLACSVEIYGRDLVRSTIPARSN